MPYKATGRPPGRAPRPLADRVWERVERRGPNECWPTNGSHMRNGYAQFFLAPGDRLPGTSGRTTVHRVMFYITHGYWPKVVRHSCDQRWCGNPSHLLGGTSADNNRDTRERGRTNWAVGERAPHAKLTEADVLLIRASPETNVALARRYGVDQSAISNIRRRRNWKHI